MTCTCEQVKGQEVTESSKGLFNKYQYLRSSFTGQKYNLVIT